jgi:hypothetical protein
MAEKAKFEEETPQVKTKPAQAQKILGLIEATSCHALPNIIRTQNHIVRSMWVVAFSASLIYSIISIVNMIIDYYDYEVVVSIEEVQDFELEFPAITICNYNPIDYTQKGAIKTVEEYLFNVTNKTSNSFGYNNKGYGKDSCNQNYKQYFESDSENFLKFGFPLDKMLIECRYDAKPCTRDDFFPVNSILFGKCYSFNTGKSSNGSSTPVRKLARTGLDNGLKLELYVGASEYLPCWMHENGALVVVHNRSEPPLFIEEGVKLQTGVEANVGIKKGQLKMLPRPYSDCVQDVYSADSYDSNSYRETVRRDKIYTQKWCILSCASILNAESNAKECSSHDLKCIKDVSNISSYFPECSSECPAQCECNHFKMHSNFAKYPSKAYAEYLLSDRDVLARFPYENVSVEQLTGSVLALNVYYEKAVYQRIVETPRTSAITLISNLGGQLGLFLGVSLLSFVEIFEVLIEIGLAFVKKVFF